MSVMNLYGTIPKAKYKSYTGDMNGTVKNKLLTQIVDENIMALIISIQQGIMNNGQSMYQSFISMQSSYIYLLS